MNGEATIAAAQLLQAAMLDGHKLEALPERLRPRDLDEGYAVQSALAKMIGPTVGWKLAATAAAARESMGLDEPIHGSLCKQLRREPRAELSAEGLAMGVAEAEFAFSLARDLPLRERPYEAEEVAGAVAAVHPAIEVPDSRFRDYRAAGAAQIAADCAFAGRFVLGAGTKAWRHLDLAVHPVTIAKDGVEVESGSGAAVLGDPLRALAWLATRSEHGGLRRGQIVLTGSATVPVAVGPGVEILADFGELGAVGARFAPSAGPVPEHREASEKGNRDELD